MFARIGVMRALNRKVERMFDRSRKDTRLAKCGTGDARAARWRSLQQPDQIKSRIQRPPSGGLFCSRVGASPSAARDQMTVESGKTTSTRCSWPGQQNCSQMAAF
jgi:hypothetical protein